MPMNLYVVSPHDDGSVLHDWEVVSPELALVDPELAQRARAQLPHPGEREALARIAALLERTHAPPRLEPRTAIQRTRNHERWLAPVLAGAALVAVLVLTDVRVEIGRTLASADTPDAADSSTQSAPTPGPSPAIEPSASVALPPAPSDKPAAPGRTRATKPPARTPIPKPRAQAPVPKREGKATPRPRIEPQRFAWAPVADASGYHVELFRGSKKVFAADTARPALTVPRRWTYAGRPQELEPGVYRWYVWPVTAGRRAVRATVQAALTIPAR
jgi:hypothetical protein